jgi:ribosomal subunit interface protein
MNIIISGKNFRPSKANKEFVQEKFSHLIRYDKDITQITVELDADKKERDYKSFRVEAWVEGSRRIQGGSQGLDFFRTVEAVIHKLRVQIVKEKKKKQMKKKVVA